MTGDERPLILVHEDDEDLLTILCETLAVLGYRVIGKAGQLQPETWRFHGAPDLIVMDLMLRSEPSGIEITQTLRDLGIICPVIAVSASHQMADMARASGLFVAVLDKLNDLLTIPLTGVIADALQPEQPE